MAFCNRAKDFLFRCIESQKFRVFRGYPNSNQLLHDAFRQAALEVLWQWHADSVHNRLPDIGHWQVLPHQMALGLDGNTLYVAETGGETIDIVDLNAQAVTGRITLPPIPRIANATALTSVNNLAVGLTALQFMMSNGNLWEVIGGQAVPRTGTYVTGVSATTGAQTAIATPSYYQSMVASTDGSTILLMGGTGETYLYNGLTDTYTTSNQVFTAPITGYYGPVGAAANGAFLLANGLVMNQSLTAIGGATAPGQAPVTPPSSPGQTNGVAQSPLRNVAAVAPVDQTSFLRMTTDVRTSITTAATDDIHTTLQLVNTATGEPTGMLLERAHGLVDRLLSPPNPQQYRVALQKQIAELNQVGLTSLTNPSTAPGAVALLKVASPVPATNRFPFPWALKTYGPLEPA